MMSLQNIDETLQGFRFSRSARRALHHDAAGFLPPPKKPATARARARACVQGGGSVRVEGG
jgi:hypothetical protein